MSASATSPLSPVWKENHSGHGAWTRRDAAHLLRRTGFGATNGEIDQAYASGPAAMVDRLLAEQPESPEFLARDEALYSVAIRSSDVADLRAWWGHRMLNSANTLAEKMTLFWHSHFATSNAKVQSVPQMAAQNALFRQHALGSFRELLHGVARDVAMLVWLDGNANRRRQPNENFARELMELFSLGVGNYTERDIKEAARAFSGWHVRQGQFWLNTIQLDKSGKTVFGRTGNFDADDVVRLCLEQEAAPRFLASKLLRYFVLPAPPEDAVRELANCLRANDYALQPVLRSLFSSAIFFSPQARHAIIKSPADFVLGTQRILESKVNLRESVSLMGQLGQSLFEPPTVEGWKGGRAWINSATLLARANFAAELTTGNRFGTIAEPAETAARLGWKDARDAVGFYSELLLSRDIPAAQPVVESYLKQASGPLSGQLRGVLHLLLTLPEFQLI